MIWVQYDLETGDILATNSLKAEALPSGSGQIEVQGEFRPEGKKIDVNTLEAIDINTLEVVDGD